MTQADNIMHEVAAERLRQDDKWGVQNHHPFVWLAILGEEVGEANQAVLEAHFWETYYDAGTLGTYRKELIQIAAVAVAAIECLDRGKFPQRLALEAEHDAD